MPSPLDMVRPRSRKSAVRPAGTVPPVVEVDVPGLFLDGLPSNAEFWMEGVRYIPSGPMNFVPVPADGARRYFEIRTPDGNVRSASVALYAGPARHVQWNSFPLVQDHGREVLPVGDVRVDLRGALPYYDVTVDGVPVTDPITFDVLHPEIWSVQVPSGPHVLGLRPNATAPAGTPALQLPLILGPGDIEDIDISRMAIDSSIPVATGAPVPVGVPVSPTVAPGTPTTSSTAPPVSAAVSEEQGQLHLSVSPEVVGTVVTVSGQQVSGPPYRVQLDPGGYTVRVVAPGYATFEAPFQIGPGMITDVPVALAPSVLVSRPPADMVPKPTHTGLKVAAWIGAGVVLLVTGVVIGRAVMAANEESPKALSGKQSKGLPSGV